MVDYLIKKVELRYDIAEEIQLMYDAAHRHGLLYLLEIDIQEYIGKELADRIISALKEANYL